MQWSIGFSRGNIETIIREKNLDIPFNWIPISDNINSIADPFIFKDDKGNMNLLYEEFSEVDTTKYGKIVLATLNKRFSITQTKEILDTKSHSSYPFVIVENGITYVVPETSKQRKVSLFEYDFITQSLVNEKILIDDVPLLDSTIIKHNNKYWLFATININEYDYCNLCIYYAENLFGPYKAHTGNPVKNNLDGSRPAGSIIKVDGDLYRPAQNCSLHYGESIAINKITRLTETEFSEELYFKIAPDKSSKYNSGVHTINIIDDIIVLDGIKMMFMPFTKWKHFIKKKLQRKGVKKVNNHFYFKLVF